MPYKFSNSHKQVGSCDIEPIRPYLTHLSSKLYHIRQISSLLASQSSCILRLSLKVLARDKQGTPACNLMIYTLPDITGSGLWEGRSCQVFDKHFAAARHNIDCQACCPGGPYHAIQTHSGEFRPFCVFMQKGCD